MKNVLKWVFATTLATVAIAALIAFSLQGFSSLLDSIKSVASLVQEFFIAPVGKAFGEPKTAATNGLTRNIFLYIILGWFTFALFCHTAQLRSKDGAIKKIADYINDKKESPKRTHPDFGEKIISVFAKIIDTIHVLNITLYVINTIHDSHRVRDFLIGTSNGLMIIGLLGAMIIGLLGLPWAIYPIITELQSQNGHLLLSNGSKDVLTAMRDAIFLIAWGVFAGFVFRLIIFIFELPPLENYSKHISDNKGFSKFIQFLVPALTFWLATFFLLVAFLVVHSPAERWSALEDREEKLKKEKKGLLQQEYGLDKREARVADREAKVADSEEKVNRMEAWEERLTLMQKKVIEKISNNAKNGQGIGSGEQNSLAGPIQNLATQIENLASQLPKLEIKPLAVKVEPAITVEKVVVESPPNDPNGEEEGRRIEHEIFNALDNKFNGKKPLCGGLELSDSDSRRGVLIKFNSPSVQFETDESTPQEGFKEVLECFFPRFVKVLGNDKFRDEIGEIRIQGHASRVWEKAETGEDAYFHNMRLSQERTRETLRHVLPLPQVYGRDHKCWPRHRIEDYNKEDTTKNDPECWLLRALNADGWSSGRAKEDDESSRRIEFEVRGKWRMRLGN